METDEQCMKEVHVVCAAQTVRDALVKYEDSARQRALETGDKLAWVIIDLSPVSEVDATAVHFWCAFAAICIL